jgi:GTP-binding protein Era
MELTKTAFKAGFVNIVGNPNVGKSTLMNSFLGEKLSIVTPKAQTTRHRILGILDGPYYQIVFSDTPGILKPHYKMHEAMMKAVESALEDADLLIYMTDVVEKYDKNPEIIKKINEISVPVLLLINKIDLTDQDTVAALVKIWQNEIPRAEVMAISAIHQPNLAGILNRIVALLPEHPPFFPQGQLSDKTERFFVEEIIREKIFLNYAQEIPYSTHVEVESFKEEASMVRIHAVIYVMRPSQKGILIGKQGEALKKVGIQARQEVENFLGKKVHLELFVKVRANWRDKPGSLRSFGYEL